MSPTPANPVSTVTTISTMAIAVTRRLERGVTGSMASESGPGS